MGGFIRGRVECLFNNKDQNYNHQNIFVTLYQFFTSHPQYTLLAVNWGATNGPAATGAGTGPNFVDAVSTSTTPASTTFGNNAWFLVRQNASPVRPYDVFHLFQWTGANNFTRGANFGTAPGNPGLANGSVAPNTNNNPSIAHSCAIGISGSGGNVVGQSLFGGSTSGSLGAGFGNPWRGSMNALTGVLGIDQKANGGSNNLQGVWGAPPASGSYSAGTGVIIWPRSNCGDTGAFRFSSTAGHFAENMGNIAGGSGTNNDVRMFIIADDDSWVFWHDNQDTNNGTTTMSYAGIYTPRNGLPSGSQSGIVNYVVLQAEAALPWSITNGSIYGDIAGTSTQQGGIVANTTASVRPVVMDQSVAFMLDLNYQPNYALSSSTGGQGGVGIGGGAFYDEFQIPLGIFENSPAQISGYLGELDFIRSCYNIQTPSVRWDYQRAFFGSITIQDRKYSVPWDSQNKTIPRTGTNRNGINFVRPPPA